MINHGVSQRTKRSLLALSGPQRLFFFLSSVKDIWQYYLNLTEANREQRSDWRLEYTMSKAFGLADLRPASLLQLGRSFQKPSSSSFTRYFSHFMVGYDRSIVCQDDCKVDQVCAVLYLDQPSYSKCIAAGGKWWPQ